MTVTPKLIIIALLFVQLIIGGPTTGLDGEGPEGCTRKIDLCFVLDHSGSIGPEHWPRVKEFVIKIVETLNIGLDQTRVALVTFGNLGIVRFNLLEYTNKASLIEAINNLPSGQGNTYTAIGLRATREQVFQAAAGDREEVPNVAILITDGQSTVNRTETIPEAQRAHRANITVYAVGVTSEVNQYEIQQISSPPQLKGKNYFLAPDFFSLNEYLPDLRVDMCSEKNNENDCQLLDLTFVIRMPTTDSNCTALKNYLIDIVNTSLVISPNQLRVSMVSFDTNARIQFLLDKYQNEAEVISAISTIPCSTPSSRSESNAALSDALRLVREQILAVNGRAARRNIKKAVFLVTDGGFTDNATVYSEADMLRGLDVKVVAVGVTNKIPIASLRKIAYTIDDVVAVETYNDLMKREARVIERICSLTPPPTFCYDVMDLVLILDESGSITEGYDGYRKNWKIGTLGFARDIVTKFVISENRTKVAVVKFADTAQVSISLDEYRDLDSLTNAIANISNSGGGTNIAQALRYTRRGIFRVGRGFRRSVAHVVVLITDGEQTVTSTSYTLEEEARQLKQVPAEVFVVGVGRKILVQQLWQIASEPYETHTFLVDEVDQLYTIVNDLLPRCPTEMYMYSNLKFSSN